MIIFDYATLADDSHRRHFIDPKLNPDFLPIYRQPFDYMNPKNGQIFKPDYAAYYAAGKDDRPIEASIKLFYKMWYSIDDDVKIWCDFDESFREIVIKWLVKNIDDISHFRPYEYFNSILKMRPDGDTTPWHELKEMWMRYGEGGKDIELAFEPSGSPMIPIWKKYGVTVMEVNNG